MERRSLVPLLEEIVKSLVGTPRSVQVKQLSNGGCGVYEIDVEKSERGMVIGRKGVSITAIRNIMRIVGRANGYNDVEVSVVEN